MNEKCLICHAALSDERGSQGQSLTFGHVDILYIIVDNSRYCGVCVETGIKMLLEGKA